MISQKELPNFLLYDLKQLENFNVKSLETWSDSLKENKNIKNQVLHLLVYLESCLSRR